MVKFRLFRHLVLVCTVFISSTEIVVSQTVTIEGSVELIPAPVARLSMGGYGGSVVQSVPGERNIATGGVLIWLEDQDASSDYRFQNQNSPILDQEGKHFHPRLMGIHVGQSVRIQNSDPYYHNVFSLSRVNGFNVGMRSPNDSDDIVEFNAVEAVDVFCDLHPDMHAVIMVLPKQTHSWMQLVESGIYRFEDVPPGQYTMHFFSIGGSRLTRSVSVNGQYDVSMQLVTLEVR